jgi:putative membrane protein (TIGR04086 family)
MIRETGQSIKATLNERLNIITIIKGIAFSYIITIPLFLIFAFILTYSDFPEKFISPIVIIVTIASILLAGAFSTRRMKSKGWLNGGVVGFIYIFLLYLFSSRVSKNFSFDNHITSMFIIGVLSGSIGGIIGINLKAKNHKKSKIKKR